MSNPAPIRRKNSKIVRSAFDEIRSIQTLLSDVYKDAGGGLTLIRELVQNADDAGATNMAFAVLSRGWSDADNSLLRGPALVVVNDGPFTAANHEGLHQAVGGSKAEETDKVGRFGIGMKSVFHICEAFSYVGTEADLVRVRTVNPWAGTGDDPDSDPVHPDWDTINDADAGRLLHVARELMGPFEDGLLLWIPLRLAAHRDRGEDGKPYSLAPTCPTPQEIASSFRRREPLVLLLTQCGHLESIEVAQADSPGGITSSSRNEKLVKEGFQPREWVGRPQRDKEGHRRLFSGSVNGKEGNWTVRGIDAVGSPDLDDLRQHLVQQDKWPRDPRGS